MQIRFFVEMVVYGILACVFQYYLTQFSTQFNLLLAETNAYDLETAAAYNVDVDNIVISAGSGYITGAL